MLISSAILVTLYKSMAGMMRPHVGRHLLDASKSAPIFVRGYRPNTYRSRGCKKVWVASPSRDFAPNKYERTGQLQLLHKSYHDGLPAEKLGPDGEPSFANGCDRTQQLYVPRYNSLIGNTPLVDLSALSENPKVRILGKCEFMNPSASIKDRIAQHIVMEAERTGKLKPGGTVVAATSGNTGSAVAMMCAMRGYKYIVITNEKTSKEKTDSMAAYGGKVIVAPCGVPADDPMHYQNMASTLCKENPDYFDVDQYDNPNNPEAYYRSLGPEIWEQSQGQVTHFVAGGSTGGTISGTGRYLKEASNGQVKVVMPDPVGSVFWDYFMNKVEECELSPKSYQVEGVGKDSIPGAMNFQVVDEMVQVTDKQAFQLCRRVANTEGMLVGGSAGLNLHAAVELSRKIDEGVIVAILCDSGIKYLSKIYCDEWMVAKGFMDGEDPQADAMEYVPVCGTAHLMKEGAAVASSLSAAASPPMQASAAAVSAESADRVLQKVADKLVRYVAEVNDRTQPVVELASPDELKAAFASAGVPLSLAAAAAPASEEQLMSAVDQTLKYSVKTGHPMFFNQLYARADPVSIAGDWLTIAANTNVHTYEVAPVFTVVEVEVLAKMAQLVGGAYAQAHEGLFVPGGSLSNLYGMHLARNRACPELRSKGAAGGPTLVAFTSDQAHYSYKKGAMLSGIGTDNLVAVETDERGQMRPDALERAIVAAKDAGEMPFFVGATAGTTVLGAFDPFAELADVCERHGVWLHIDGCWGASVLVSERLRHLMAGCERADSIAWNAHKMMGLPLQCSAFLNRHPGALMAANASNAAYLFQPDKLNTEYDLGDRTIQCGRKADAFKLWLAWKAYGDAGYAERVEHCFRLAEHFERAVASSNGSLVLAYPRNCTNVCFWVVPRSMRPFDPATAPQQQLNRIAQVAPAVKNLMQRKGDAMIGFQPVGGLPNFFRIVFANAWIVTVAELDAMVERMVAYADELFP